VEPLGSLDLATCWDCPLALWEFLVAAAVWLGLLVACTLGATGHRAWRIALGRLGLILLFPFQGCWSFYTVRFGVALKPKSVLVPGLAEWLVAALAVASVAGVIFLWRRKRKALSAL
jgi:hypothetical protein